MAAALPLPKTVAVRGRASSKPLFSLSPPTVRELAIADIALDVKLQPRDQIDDELVAEYAEAIASGAVFPPVTVFAVKADGRNLLADGWHRLYAHRKAGRDTIAVEITPTETFKDALRFSLRANARHGKRRDGGTLARAYRLACEELGVDPCDVKAVANTLEVAERTARMLTKDARGARAVEAKSLVRVLREKEVPQAEIADMLAKAGIIDVAQQTVADWITGFGTNAKSGKADKPKSDAPEYEIPTVTAKQIGLIWDKVFKEAEEHYKPQMKAQLEKQLADLKKTFDKDMKAELARRDKAAADLAKAVEKERAALEAVATNATKAAERSAKKIEALTEKLVKLAKSKALPGDEVKIAELNRQLGEEIKTANEAKAAVEAERKAAEKLRADIDEAKKAAAMTAEEAKAAALEQVKWNQSQLWGPPGESWGAVLRAFRAIADLSTDLANLPFPSFEHKVWAEHRAAIRRIQEIAAIAKRNADWEDPRL